MAQPSRRWVRVSSVPGAMKALPAGYTTDVSMDGVGVVGNGVGNKPITAEGEGMLCGMGKVSKCRGRKYMACHQHKDRPGQKISARRRHEAGRRTRHVHTRGDLI